MLTKEEIIARIDHTFLKPYYETNQWDSFVKEWQEYKFASVCVAPCHIEELKTKGPHDNICTVIDFPHGSLPSELRIAQAIRAIDLGAVELDLVVPLSLVARGNRRAVEKDLLEFVIGIRGKDVTTKLIIETAYLTKEQISTYTKIGANAGFDFIKTSTGFAPRGASLEDIDIMNESLVKEGLRDKVRLKASGGIRTYEDFAKYVERGVERIGTSSAGVMVGC